MNREFTPGQPCHLCKKPMVDRYSRREDTPPGHAPHKGNGHCNNCYMRLFKERKEATEISEWLQQPLTVTGFKDPDPDVRHNAWGLQMWLDDRREREIPTTGLKK